MKDRKTRKQTKTVYVLGAGASYSASTGTLPAAAGTCPLDINFCKRILSLSQQRPKWVVGAVKDIQRCWLYHRGMEEFGLEAAIIQQLSHMRFLRGVQPRRPIAMSEQQYINHLAHLICFVLRRARESRTLAYKRLVDRIFPPWRRVEDCNDRIITFNYDDLIDTHILKRHKPATVYFDRIKSSPDAGDRRHRRFQHPLLIKLHGSINWRCNTVDYECVLNSDFGGTDPYWLAPIWLDSSRLPSPSDSISPCIIPPLPNKPITQISLFKFLWTKAYEYLHEADRLVICGYSLPETDPLALSLFGNFKNSRLKAIDVVDRNPAILDRWRTLLIRKGVPRVRWTYYSDFVEYVDALPPLKKRKRSTKKAVSGIA